MDSLEELQEEALILQTSEQAQPAEHLSAWRNT